MTISYALAPGVTVNQNSRQKDPTSDSSSIPVAFSGPVAGFTDADLP